MNADWFAGGVDCDGNELITIRADDLRQFLNAQDRMLNKWAEVSDEKKTELWTDLHRKADAVRAQVSA